ncbi:hypothetical protein B5F17_01825 [Butyricicoccus pullicaecorum]|uniref:Uncharacterized protein n=1 Tax=Butyricicoccus pullicaecorum TaxID=501571 RepID=A0A1Y4LB75_9FIRM|nr:hypothetical protein [Butyricicoccus pullicaecorum]OUP53974.1 hypothetical protein B5F17_01825 [Butyricicoccus pullicaecorum]
MSFLSGLIGGAIGSAVSNAIKNQNKGSSSSSGSLGGSSSSLTKYPSTTTSKPGSKPSYDPNRDYQADIDKAVADGDYAKAAILEQERNNKIKDMGLNYGTTNKYSQYLNGGSGTSAGNSGNSNIRLPGLGGGLVGGVMGNVMGNVFGQTAGSLVSGSNNQQSVGHPVINWNPNEAPLYGKDDSKGWKDNVDYQALINDAVKNNNYAQAAILEQQRNNKIDSLGLNADKTNKYSSYLGGTSLKSIADLYDPVTKTFHITADDPNSKNTGAGKGLTEADLTWAKGSATYNQDFKKYMDDMAARIAVYEASSDPVLRSHLPGMYNAMANYENQRNAKLMAMGRGDLVTNDWQAYSHSTRGWEKDFNDVGNGAGMLSAEQIAGYEQTAAKLQNAFEQATNDYQREEIWKDLASYNRMLGRAWDADTRQFSASTVSPVKDYYGSSGGAYSYGAMTNGSMTGDAAQALARQLQQDRLTARDNYGSDGVNWYDNPESLLSGKPRIPANGNLWPNVNGWTIPDLQSDFEMAKVRGDQAAMDAAHAAAEAIRQSQGYSGGPDGSQKISLPGMGGNITSNIVGNVVGGTLGQLLPGLIAGQTQTPVQEMPTLTMDDYLDEYYAAQQDYRDYMEQAAQNAQNAIQAGVDNAVAGLNNQKGTIQQAGDIANQAAQQTYMDAINPNGATAEQLAALGLRSSGLTESSMISAGNTLQSSINSNLQNVNNQLAQIDLAITQAKSQGDIAAAQALEQYYAQIASQMMNDANTVLAYRQQQQAQQQQLQQWMYEMQQQAAQNAWNQQFQQNQFDWNKQQQDFENRNTIQQRAYDAVMQALATDTLPSHTLIVQAGLNDTDIYNMWKNLHQQRQSGLYG